MNDEGPIKSSDRSRLPRFPCFRRLWVTSRNYGSFIREVRRGTTTMTALPPRTALFCASPIHLIPVYSFLSNTTTYIEHRIHPPTQKDMKLKITSRFAVCNTSSSTQIIYACVLPRPFARWNNASTTELRFPTISTPFEKLASSDDES